MIEMPRHLITIANLITAFRAFLFVWLIYFAHLGQVWPMATLFALAWGLDAVDGWVARRLKQATAFGFVFDKVVDRVVVIGTVFVGLVYGLIPLAALFLVAKDMVAGPMVARRVVRGQNLLDMAKWGKAATLLQGLAVLWLLLGLPYQLPVIIVVSLFGVGVSVWYLRQVMRT